VRRALQRVGVDAGLLSSPPALAGGELAAGDVAATTAADGNDGSDAGVVAVTAPTCCDTFGVGTFGVGDFLSQPDIAATARVAIKSKLFMALSCSPRDFDKPTRATPPRAIGPGRNRCRKRPTRDASRC